MNSTTWRMIAAAAGVVLFTGQGVSQESRAGGAAGTAPATSSGPPGSAAAVEAFRRPAFIAGRGPGTLRAADFIGKAVYNPSGASIGEVDDVLFENGRLSGLVIDIGGFLGVGEREVALPLDAFRMDPATTATSGTIGGLPASTVEGARTRVESRTSPVVVPERIVLLLPEDQLQAAPPFVDGSPRRSLQ